MPSYIDPTSGNDTTGDGTAALPWLTLQKGFNSGDVADLRIAKTAAPSVDTSCNYTFTANSKTINTSADVSGVWAVGDYIGKTTAAGGGAIESYYRVTARTSTTLTIEVVYYGTTATVASVKKLNPVTVGGATSHWGDPGSYDFTITGGWNLATQTRDGETWVQHYNRRGSATYYVVGASAASYTSTIDGLNIVDTTYPVYLANAYIWNFSNMSFCGITAGLNMNSATFTFNNFYYSTAASSGNVFYIYGNTYPKSFTNTKFHAAGGDFYLTKVNKYYCSLIGSTIIGMTVTYNSNDTHLWSATIAYPTSANAISCVYDFCSAQDITMVGLNTVSGVGLNIGTTLNGFYGARITIPQCSYGMFLSQSVNCLFEDVAMTSPAVGVYQSDVYCGGNRFRGLSCVTPNTWFFSKIDGSGTMYLDGCSIDTPSIAKAYNNISGQGQLSPTYTLQSSFGKSGSIWYYGSYLLDTVNYDTVSPCLAITNDATNFSAERPYTLSSGLINSGVRRTISVKLKGLAGWSGNLVVRWRLNGKLIKTEATAITALTTSYVTYSWTVDSSLVTEDGVLTVEAQGYVNQYSWYVSDRSYS